MVGSTGVHDSTSDACQVEQSSCCIVNMYQEQDCLLDLLLHETNGIRDVKPSLVVDRTSEYLGVPEGKDILKVGCRLRVASDSNSQRSQLLRHCTLLLSSVSA